MREAESIGVFDEVIAYGPENLSEKVLSSELFSAPRGGGFWCWKPDIILSSLKASEDGDIIVYCDAGCSIYKSSEWNRYWKQLEAHDIIVQRILQPNDQWTRKELIELFVCNGTQWLKDYQYLSGIIFFKNTPFTRSFVSEWRDLMLTHPECVADVPAEKRYLQHSTFIESRHDQSVLSALIYKYMLIPETQHLIYPQWEHVEFFDIIRRQAIRATRLRTGDEETSRMKLIAIRRRFLLDFVLKPFSGIPLHWWYNRKF